MSKRILAKFEDYRFENEMRGINQTAKSGNEILTDLFVNLPNQPQNDEELKQLIESKDLKPFFPQPYKEAEFEFNLGATGNTKRFEKATALINQLTAVVMRTAYEIKDLQFVVSKELDNSVREKHSLYLETEPELKFYAKVQKLADLLNDLTTNGKINYFKTNPISINIDLGFFDANHKESPKFIVDPEKVFFAHRRKLKYL